MTSNQNKNDLVQQSGDLERELNRLTDQAELAVLQDDPVAYFLRATNQDASASSK